MSLLQQKMMPAPKQSNIRPIPTNQYADNMISGIFDGAKKIGQVVGPYIPTIFAGVLTAHVARALWKNHTKKARELARIDQRGKEL